MMRRRSPMRRRTIRVPKECYFCTAKIEPYYRETDVLGRFVSDRGKIQGKAHTGICSKHQRILTREIKRARYLALLPFIVRPI